VLFVSQAELLRRVRVEGGAADSVAWWARVATSAAGKAARSVELGGAKIGQDVQASGVSMRRGMASGAVVSLVGDGGRASGSLRAACVVQTDGVTFAGGATGAGGVLVVSDASKDDSHLAALAAIVGRVERVRARLARRRAGYWCADNDRDGQDKERAEVWADRRGWRGCYWRAARRAAGREVSARSLRVGITGQDSELQALGEVLPVESESVVAAMDSARVSAWMEGEGANPSAPSGHTVGNALRKAWRVLVIPARAAVFTSQGRARANAVQAMRKGFRSYRLIAGVLRGEPSAIAALRDARKAGGKASVRHAAAFAAVGGDEARAILSSL